MDKSRKGSMLIIAIWFLAILTFFATALCRRINAELVLTKYEINKFRARCAAWSGFQYALKTITTQGQKDTKTHAWNHPWECAEGAFSTFIPPTEDYEKPGEWSSGRDCAVQTPIRLWRIGAIGRGLKGHATHVSAWGSITDEESKINLNALTSQDYLIFEELMTILGIDHETAQTIAASAVDWRDEDQEVTNSPYGDEGEFYQKSDSLYLCKNRPYGQVEELVLVKGMTPEIFEKIIDFVTVYPPRPTQQTINFNTAPEEVLRALGRTVAGPASNTSKEDADAVARKVVDFRKGGDGIQGTADDPPLESDCGLWLNSKERAVFLSMTRYRAKIPQFFRILVQGTENRNGAWALIDAVVDRDNLSVISWRAD